MNFKSAAWLTAGLSLFSLTAPANATLYDFSLIFSDPSGPATGGFGTLELNLTSIPANPSSISIGNGDSRFVSLTANVDGGVFDFTSINNIGISNGVFNNISANEVLSSNGLTLSLSTGGLTFNLFGVNNSGVGNGTITVGAATPVSAVPEPSTWAMMILGFCGLGFMAYRRKQNGPALQLT
jgi:PEP-CTERM motif